MVAHLSAFRSSLEKGYDDAIIACVGYFPLAVATIHFTSNGRNHAAMWPADALILALLLLNARINWPVILTAGWAANLLANTVTREWTPGLIVYGGINMAQTGVAAWLLCRSGRRENLLADLPTVLRFVLYAGVVAPVFGAVAGSIASTYNYGEPFWPSVVRWYISNALGLLILTPFLMAVFDGDYIRQFKEIATLSRMEMIGLQALHLIVTVGVFAQSILPLSFLPVSTTLILSFRQGRLGTALGAAVLAAVGVVATLMGHGPIAMLRSDPAAQEILFQFYLATVLATTLPVAATVSSRAEALANLAEREAALRLMMAHSPDGILSFDITGDCRWADGPLGAYLGIEPRAMVGRSLDDMALHVPALAEKMLACSASGDDHPVSFEFTPLLRPQLTLEASIGALLRSGVRVGTVVTLRDVSRRKAKEVAILSKAQTDDLTGLVNRSGFRKHQRAFLADRSRPTTLALVDVDNFKSINDRYGHAIGDAVLSEIAKRLKIATRAEDVVCRLGGDEFALLLRCDVDTAQKICERMVASIRETPVFNDGNLSILSSVSCGIAEYGPDMSREQVFDVADAALYEVKRSGRNNVRVAA